jgi:hypothetical protein
VKTKDGPDQRKPQKHNNKQNKTGKSRVSWLISIFVMALTISATFSFLSQELLSFASLIGAFLVLLAIISVGVLFDLLGIAVAAADEKPFHSMAARKVRGSNEAIWLLRNAGKVSTICNDVVGDICGIISGSAAAVIAVEAYQSVHNPSLKVIQLLLSAVVAALTICGKAFFKQIALDNCTPIVHSAAKVVCLFKSIFHKKSKRSKKEKYETK